MGELLKSISENPELIAEFTTDQIAEARAELEALSAAIKAGEVAAGSAEVEEATALAVKLTEREEAIAADEAKKAEEIAALDAALGITVEEEAEIVAQEEDPDEEDGEESEEDDEEAKVEVVVASAPSLGAIAKLAPRSSKPVDPEEPEVLIASAGVHMGKALTASSYGELAIQAWQSGPGEHRLAQAQVQHKYEVVKGDDEHNARVFAQIAEEATTDVLTAAGGICAPPEVLYGFFNIATQAGILNLPAVNAPRGAISLPVSPSLGDILGEAGIATEWTAANDADPTPSPATKPVYVFDCPDFETCTVSAWPTIIQVGNFAARFFPEAIANLTSLAVVASARTLNAARIAFLLANDVAGNVTDTGGGGLNQLTTNLAGNAMDYRATYGMSPTALLDVVLPAWVPEALLADAIARDSTTEYGDIRGKVDGLLRSLNLRAQFVYDLDDQADGDIPNVATAIMFAPGTVVELDGGTLDLGVVRDSTLQRVEQLPDLRGALRRLVHARTRNPHDQCGSLPEWCNR